MLCASDVASASLTRADPLKNIKPQKMRASVLPKHPLAQAEAENQTANPAAWAL